MNRRGWNERGGGLKGEGSVAEVCYDYIPPSLYVAQCCSDPESVTPSEPIAASTVTDSESKGH